ncbi:Sensor protein FixL [Gemmata obscuriglobus]|uniref:PAS domain S-box protein n=1 Tax=Gemmata obscuriglobus TaxID=114 RepID=UPI0011CD1522|nr:PAS domain S-box protein [Gemmata obscuriglobus]QEG29337.1 Sensor protein FixL [Gemmata obscuriglobus]VTS08347.1 diguanylate partial : Histidine kinase OS=Nitrosococcus halophilus (strain Nc4) GN=Nhal_0114 PE=4 SV=1: PAS_9: PAS_4: PAS_4: PAS_8: PAS_8: HisKA: HATPase_c [Gemmata obscuriglobus UQM 2246]
MLDALSDGVLVVGPDGVIGSANRPAEVLFGYGPGELCDVHLDALVPDRARRDHERHRLARATDQNVQAVCRRPGIRGRRKDGTEFPVEVAVRPFHGGAVLAVVRAEHVTPARGTETALGRAVVGALDELVAVVDRSGVIVATSAGWEECARATGCPAQRCAVGANYLDACRQVAGPNSAGAAEMCGGLAAVLSGTADRFAAEYPCPSGGAERWYRAVVKPLPNESGGAVVVHHDVTARRAAERALAESEQRFRGVVEAQTELLCRTLPDGTLTYVNGPYCRYFGRTPEQLLGRRFWELLPEPEREYVARHLAALTPTRPVASVENRVIGAGGELRWHEWTNRAFFDDAGRVTGFQSVGRDVTDRVRAADALRASEARFRDLFQNSPLATACWRGDGADFVLADCNEAARRLTAGGITRVLGRRLSELHRNQPDHRASVARCLRERSAFECESRWAGVDWVGPAGPDGDVLVSYSFVPPDLVMSAMQFITARKQQERALRESAERNRLILSALHEGVLLLDAGGRVLKANESAARIFGGTTDRLLGTRPGNTLGRVRGADGLPVAADLLPWEVVRLGGGVCVGVVLVLDGGRDGEPVRLVVNAHALPGTGAPFPVVASLTDTTAQWRAEEQLHQHQAELAHVARCVAVGEMAAVLAHELNQPLTAVINYCRGGALRLRGGTGTTAEVADVLDLTVAQAERAARIIRRLRDFMRKRAPHRSTTELNDPVRDALALAGPELRHHHVAVTLDLGAGLPPVQADRIQIEQVLLNLLRNATEALTGTPPGARMVAITTRRAPDGVRVEVADTGTGLRPDELERVFEPFYTTKEQGTGLGLAISRSIIEAHGGHLSARPADGGGAAFAFTLPVAGAD